MCILTADLNLRWAAMYKCMTEPLELLFFNREELFGICCTGEMERAMKKREKSTHSFFVFIFYTCTSIKFPAYIFFIIICLYFHGHWACVEPRFISL